ncbi:MAG: MFS transporter [Proteobacteria bacterium]|nr:MFS transporter [Pseudomonadota bacterium]
MSKETRVIAPEDVVKTITKFNYGVGASSVQLQEFVFNAILFFFYVNVVGLSGTLAGLATFISLIFDAVSDPLVGSISDRWQSKRGRRHPFMFASALPLSISFYFLFTPPASSNQWVTFGWLLLFSILVKFGITLFSVPHLAFGSELSRDFIERSKVMAYNTVFLGIGGVTGGILAYGVFFKKTPEFSNGLLNAAQYPKYALVISVLMFVAILYTSFLTRGEISRLPKAPQGISKFKTSEFLTDVWMAVKNRNFLVTITGMLLVTVATGTYETIALFSFTYFWELTTLQLTGFPIVVLLSSLTAFILAPRLHLRYGKKNSILIFLTVYVVFVTAPIILRLLGIFFPNHHPAVYPILVAQTYIFYVGLIAAIISSWSMISDVTDENELETGRRQEGIFFSTRTLASKFTVGFGHLFGGLALDHYIRFPQGGKGAIEVGSVAPDIIWRLGFFNVSTIIVFACLAIFVYRKYNITMEKYEATRQKLEGVKQERS